ncbi:MAG: hypothetical protein HS126_08695 [Anaerolineales bacterium]|nr:hypothetical protein [Anaerolineales bacterium]
MTTDTNGNGYEETVAEDIHTEETTGPTGPKSGAGRSTAARKTIDDAFKQVENFTENLGKALGSALQDRANVVMVRVNNDSLSYLDMLVEADVTKSRSESAAFLINEGIKANEALFNRIREITDQIASLKAQLRESVKGEE